MRKTIIMGALVASAAGCAAQMHTGGVSAEDMEAWDTACEAARHRTFNFDEVLCEVGRSHDDAPSNIDKLPQPIEAAAEMLEIEKIGDGTRNESLPLAYDHAIDLDPDEVAKALAEAGVDARIAKPFEARLRERLTYVAGLAAAQPPAWRAVFIAPIDDARATWAKEEQRRAPWLAKAKPLLDRYEALAVSPDKDDPGLLSSAIALHRSYVADCEQAGVAATECLGDDVARPLTRMIVEQASAGDPMLGRAYAALLDVPNHSRVEYAVHIAAEGAFDDATAERTAWEKAQEDHRDAAAMRKRWPQPPFDPAHVTIGGDASDDAADEQADHKYRRGGQDAVRFQVARVDHSGDRAVISARRYIYEDDQGVGCYETNKVDGISDDNHLIYRTECTGTKVVHEDKTPKPVTVPWSEAKEIRPMDVAWFGVDDKRRGHVLEVQEGDASLPTPLDSDSGGATLQLGAFEVAARTAPARPAAKAARKPGAAR